MKKILYLFSYAGAGHITASKAIAEAIDEKYKDEYIQKFVDIWTLGSNLQSKFFGGESYKRATNKFPLLYGLGYWVSNNKFISRLILLICAIPCSGLGNLTLK